MSRVLFTIVFLCSLIGCVDRSPTIDQDPMMDPSLMEVDAAVSDAFEAQDANIGFIDGDLPDMMYWEEDAQLEETDMGSEEAPLPEIQVLWDPRKCVRRQNITRDVAHCDQANSEEFICYWASGTYPNQSSSACKILLAGQPFDYSKAWMYVSEPFNGNDPYLVETNLPDQLPSEWTYLDIVSTIAPQHVCEQQPRQVWQETNVSENLVIYNHFLPMNPFLHPTVAGTFDEEGVCLRSNVYYGISDLYFNREGHITLTPTPRSYRGVSTGIDSIVIPVGFGHSLMLRSGDEDMGKKAIVYRWQPIPWLNILIIDS